MPEKKCHLQVQMPEGFPELSLQSQKGQQSNHRNESLEHFVEPVPRADGTRNTEKYPALLLLLVPLKAKDTA